MLECVHGHPEALARLRVHYLDLAAAWRAKGTPVGEERAAEFEAKAATCEVVKAARLGASLVSLT